MNGSHCLFCQREACSGEQVESTQFVKKMLQQWLLHLLLVSVFVRVPFMQFLSFFFRGKLEIEVCFCTFI